ncbi:MAG: DUF502 domain-containing protein [wastewater metagenome]|nr:DUF502 domain-containing protein [Candidatus Loosdrechtia aerotolerans]
MEEKKLGIFAQFKRNVRKRMLTGLLLILPIYVTFFVVKFLFGFVGGLLSPIIKKIFLFHGISPKTHFDEFVITFLGIILTFMTLYFIGIFAANFVGKAIINYFESLLTKTPIVRNIYSSVKQIIHSISLPGKQAFKRVVLVDFPKEGTKSIGFITSTTEYNGEKKMVSIFIPTTPNPTTGFLILAPEDTVTDTNLTVEEAFKILFSGGVLTPRDIVASFRASKNSPETHNA